MGLLELLLAGDVEAFNQQRGERSRPELFAADLAEKKLCGVDLSGANLDKADLTGADLTDANLLKAYLSGIDGTGMKLVDAMAMRVKLRGAWLDESDLTGADLSRADLTEANLSGSIGPGVRMAGARLKEVDATNARWPDADLSEATLHKANLTGADLKAADLSEASGHDVVLTNAVLDGVLGAGARLQGAQLQGASLVGAQLEGANLSGADLTGANLSQADLSRANLAGAVLVGARLEGAVLCDASLDGVDLTDLDLSDVDLSGIDPSVLSEAQREQVLAVGVPWNPDAALSISQPSVALCGAVVGAVWENPDGDELSSVRYAVFGGGAAHVGVLPVPRDQLLARALVSDGDGFVALITRERPGGVATVVYRIGLDGALSAQPPTPLGYDPAVRPLLHAVDGTVRAWGLARRGPTLAVHALTDEGLALVDSQRIPTATGFLGRYEPVLACKGGVVMPVGPRRAGAPLRTPDGFQTRGATAVALGDRVAVFWVAKRGPEAPGGLRFAWLARRGGPDVQVLGTAAGVTGVDALRVGDTIHVTWIEAGEDGLSVPRVRRVVLPDGEVEELELDCGPIDEVVLLPGPALACTTLAGALIVFDSSGKRVGQLGG